MKAIRKGPGAPRRYCSLLHACPRQLAGRAANASAGHRGGEARGVNRSADGNCLGQKLELIFKWPQSFGLGATRGSFSLGMDPKKRRVAKPARGGLMPKEETGRQGLKM